MALALMAPGIAMAATYLVDTTVDNGALSACTAAAGDCSLRGAVNAVNAGPGGDIISIPAGTFTLSTTGWGDDLNIKGDLDILKAVTIQGAGAGVTTIVGAADRVIHVVGAVAVTIDRVTISGGLPNLGANTLEISGGGIYSNGSLNVTNSTISGNSTGSGLAGGMGGGIYSAATLNVTSSTISGNLASSGMGGGIYSVGALNVTNSTISGNTAGSFWGGIYSGGAVTVTNSTISGNTAGTSVGGISSAGFLTMTDSTVSGNTATISSAGGIHVGSGGFIKNSTISGNRAATWGGAINNQSAPLSIANSTIAGNTSGNGALYAFLAGADITLSNTIIAGNNPGANCAWAGGTIISAGYNIDSDGLCKLAAGTDLPGNTLITGSLGALANNGGKTKTHALLVGSPAIEKGNCSGGGINSDQRGISRPRDGNGDKLANCDIGAFEYSTNTNVAAYLNLFIVGTGSVSDGILGSAMNPCVFIPLTGCRQYYDSGATITLTATPGAGQIFIGWGGTVPSINNPLTLPKTTYHNITAVFGNNGLRVGVVGPGMVTGGAWIDCPAKVCADPTVIPGTLQTLTATPTGGAVFSGWT
ncbi:MAG: right-handed parallel beta-helix repeat-containing protein, partial [Nitrospinota bacterium]|nr:right-handed parallel beta-helix repeat-containing protein [Nitrospinota bacterium]